MKIIATTIFLVFCFFTVKAQNTISVDYKSIGNSDFVFSGTEVFKLIMYNTYSVYYKSNILNTNMKKNELKKSLSDILKENDILVKDFKKKKFYICQIGNL